MALRRCLAYSGSRTASQSGFTLIELAIVLVILGMVITIGFQFTQGYLERQRHVKTAAILDGIEEALINYAARQRRLPCPADGTANTGAENFSGSAAGAGCAAGQANGVVPWVVLGLPKNAVLDGWGNYITYRVEDATSAAWLPNTCTGNASPSRENGLNLSRCDPTAVGNPLQTRLTDVGFYVATLTTGGTVIADPTAQTGAAYFLVSHGPEGFNGMAADGTSLPDPPASLTSASARNAKLRNDVNSTVEGTSASPYVAHEPGSFDDVVRYATVMQVAVRAGLGPY